MKKERIWEIDFLRGTCILLMIFDHFWYILYKFSVVYWTNITNATVIQMIGFANAWMIGKYASSRGIGRYIVLFIFFVVAGISCTFSRNNGKRFIKSAISAALISILTTIISSCINYDIKILWGVLHCYSACLLIYLVFSKLDKKYLVIPTAIFLFIAFLLIYFKPTLENSNILMPLGIPAKNFRYAIEYFPVMKWLGVYFIGVLLGKYLYSCKHSYFQCMTNLRIKPIASIGKYGIYIYFIHFLVLVAVIYVLGVIH